jgi:hypothetical protein
MTPAHRLEPIKRIIRSEICAHCAKLPAGEIVDPAKPVSCEHDCGVFTHLPALVQIASRRDPMLAKDERAKDPVVETVRVLAHAGVYHG